MRRVWAWGPVTNPTARALKSLLWALWGQHEGARGGGAFCMGVGHPGWGALARPTTLPWGVWPGPATHWLWVREVWAWGPVTNFTARSVATWLCELSGQHEGVRGGGGGASCLGAGPPGLSVLPRPTARPWGARPGPTTQSLWVRGVWVWELVTNPAARALASRPCVLSRRHEGARGGGGGRLLPGCGASGVGRSTARPLGVQQGPVTHWLWVLGPWAWGPVINPTARALASLLCAPWGRHEGARGGGASCPGVGRPGLGALPRPTPRPWGVLPGPVTHWLWVLGLWAWESVPNPTARALASWLCALWEQQEGASGRGVFAWVRGVRGGALSRTLCYQERFMVF